MTLLSDRAGLYLSQATPRDAWHAIFAAAANSVMQVPATALERELSAGDNLLSDAAWDLWTSYVAVAPKMTDDVCAWWEERSGSSAKAILLLDSLSLREMHTLFHAAGDRGIQLDDVRVRGAQAPTDTEATAHALGLAQRSQLRNSHYSASFALAGTKPYTDVPSGIEFGHLVEHIPAARDIVLWYPWPDDLIHNQAGNGPGPANVAKATAVTLQGDGFWQLVDRLRQGRELLVTSDHGYAISKDFVNLDGALADNLKASFKGQRVGKVPAVPFSQLGEQPMYIEIGDRAAVVGPWKWRVEGGFPHLAHGGMTLGEACVPVLAFPAL